MLSVGGMVEGCFFGWVESLSREVIRDKDKNKGWMKEVNFKHL